MTIERQPRPTTPIPQPLTNPLKVRLRERQPIFGIMVTMPCVALAQVLARAGYDYLKIDFEHSPIDITSAHAMIAATAGTGAVPMARVPDGARWLVKPLLDAGALGISFPMVRSVADVRKAAEATHYPPEGERGWGPFYAHVRWGTSLVDYVEQANTEIITEVVVEQAEAIDHLDEILEVSNVDIAFVAPGDLAASLGHRGHPEHTLVQEYIARAEEKILKSKVALGGVSMSPEQTRKMLDRGYRILTLGFDWMLVQQGAAQMLKGLSLLRS